MRKESRQNSMPRCAQGARIWQVPKMLLRMRTKPGEHRGLLQLTAALFGSPTHHHNTARLHNPESLPLSQHRSNILILVPSSLNLFSWAVTQATSQLELILPAFLFGPNSNIYYFCLFTPARLSIITPGNAEGKACIFLSNLETSIVKSSLYKSLQAAPGTTFCHADEAGGKTTYKQ